MKIIQGIWSILGKEDPSIPLSNADFLKALENVFGFLTDLEHNTSFQVFKSKEDIRSWSIQNYKVWEQSLTLAEIKNIKLYTSGSFKYNEHLRQRKYPRFKNRIQHIDSALEKSSSPADIITFRWIDIEGFRRIIGSSILHPGTMFLEKGYSSTTLLFSGKIEYGADVLLILKIPKSFTGACLKNISNIQTEDEFLLKRNTIYTVEEIIYFSDTHIILLCTVQ